MKVYLDTCALQRPLDNRDQIRITLEAEAVIGIIAMCDASEVELVSSEVLHFETRRNPRSERRVYALAVLAKANTFVQVDETIEQRANALHAAGLKPLDALHLAAAEAAEAEFFCTTDDRLLKRGRSIGDPRLKIVSPVELIEELNK